MKNTKVVNLGRVRNLYAEWEKVREHFRSEAISGFQLSVIGANGKETLYVGGVYKEEPKRALRSLLRISAVRTLTEDEPLEAPEFRASSF